MEGFDPDHRSRAYPWFSFEIPAEYRTYERAVHAAADKTAKYLINGWTHQAG
jgi:hypothetical protein